jgi:cysteine synthase A
MAIEKVQLLECLGAHVERVPPASFSDPEHYCNVALRRAAEDPSGWFANQFDNLSNMRAHYETTGPELWEQMEGQMDVLVVAAGTGGLAAGLSTFLKEQDSGISVVLVDPPGSSLFLRVTQGVAFSDKEMEVQEQHLFLFFFFLFFFLSKQEKGKRKRRQVDTICEGIGITGRLTENFSQAQIDTAVQCSDQECVDMARFVLNHEGFFIGSSSAANLVGLVKAARLVPPGSRLVTLLCDAGYRHLTKFWNPEFLRSKDLLVRDFEDLSFVK